MLTEAGLALPSSKRCPAMLQHMCTTHQSLTGDALAPHLHSHRVDKYKCSCADSIHAGQGTCLGMVSGHHVRKSEGPQQNSLYRCRHENFLAKAASSSVPCMLMQADLAVLQE